MMKFNKIILAACTFMAFASLNAATLMGGASGAYAQSARESIAVVVNQGAVTNSDIEGRMRLIMASSGMPDTKEMKDKIRPQIVNMLIDENLMIQEAKRLDLEVTKEEIAEGFANLAQQNNFSPQQFRDILKAQKIPAKSLDDQIKSQIAWSKVVQAQIRPRINITENQVLSALERLKANQGQKEYLLAEIFLPVESPGQEGEVKGLSERLAQQLRSGEAPFPAIARQFSQNAAAAKGGDIGWVEASQLSDEVRSALEAMKEGDLSKPVRSLAGYHIVLLRKSRVITGETIPSYDDMLNRIGMEQLDRAQRRHLLDLKSSAFIERRV